MKDEKLIEKTIEFINKANSVVPVNAKDLMLQEAENNGYVFEKDEECNSEDKVEIKLSDGRCVSVWIPGYTVKTTYKTQKGFSVSAELEKQLDLSSISDDNLTLLKNILTKCSQQEIKKNFPVLWKYVTAAMIKTDNLGTLRQKWEKLYKDTEEFCNRIGIEGA